MFKRMGTAFRFFLIGLGVGLLTAPRSGRATRQQIERIFTDTMQNLSSSTGISVPGMPPRLEGHAQTMATGMATPGDEETPRA